MPFGLDPASDGFQNLVNRLFRGVGVKLLLNGAASLEDDLLELLVLEELVLVGLEILLQEEISITMKGSELDKKGILYTHGAEPYYQTR